MCQCMLHAAGSVLSLFCLAWCMVTEPKRALGVSSIDTEFGIRGAGYGGDLSDNLLKFIHGCMYI